jgi:glycosyltransferase involved in cell wall biosynthesis
MEEKQVLIISFWNPTTNKPHQGIFIQDQAAAICNICYNFVFLQVNIIPSNSIFYKTIEESDFHKGKRITLNLYSFLWKFLYVNPWWLERFIYRFIKKRKDEIHPQLIHSNVIHPCGIVGYLLSERLGTKLLISEHWSKAEKFLKHPVYRKIAMKAYEKSIAIICVSEFLSEKIAKATGHQNILVIPNIIDTEIFNYLEKPESKDIINFLCVASWKPPKRLDLIFEALNRFSDESKKTVYLRVVGNGIQTEKIKQYSHSKNLIIEWMGYQDKSSITEVLHSTHIFLHASDIETFSIVTVESLATGTPVAASNVGGLPELINETNGVLTENNPEAWLQAIEEMVNKQFNYQAIAKDMFKYSPEKVGRKISEVYKKALGDIPCV